MIRSHGCCGARPSMYILLLAAVVFSSFLSISLSSMQHIFFMILVIKGHFFYLSSINERGRQTGQKKTHDECVESCVFCGARLVLRTVATSMVFNRSGRQPLNTTDRNKFENEVCADTAQSFVFYGFSIQSNLPDRRFKFPEQTFNLFAIWRVAKNDMHDQSTRIVPLVWRSASWPTKQSK